MLILGKPLVQAALSRERDGDYSNTPDNTACLKDRIARAYLAACRQLGEEFVLRHMQFYYGGNDYDAIAPYDRWAAYIELVAMQAMNQKDV